MITTLKIKDGKLFSVARNGRKFGLPTCRLLTLCVKFRREGRVDFLRAAQAVLVSHRSHRI